MEEEHKKEEIKKKPRKRFRFRKVLKWIGIVMVVVILLPLLLYVPPIQNAVKDIVSEKVSEATGLDISIGRFMLKFPLRVAVDDFLVLDEHADTMVAGKALELHVKILPVFRGKVVVGKLALDNAAYRMVSSDSSMVLSARLRHFELGRSSVGLLASQIDLSEAELDGADVTIAMDVRKSQPTPPDTSAASSWLINLKRLKLNDIRYRMAMMPTIDSLDAHIPQAELQNLALNMSTSMVKVGGLTVDKLAAAYILPTAEAVEAFGYVPADTVVVDTVAPSEEPWAILADSLRISNSTAVYAVRGATPAEGLDMNCLSVENVNIAIDNFYNRGAKIRVPIRDIRLRERSGLDLRRLSGTFEMGDSAIQASDFRLETLLSSLSLNARVENGLLANDSTARVDVALESSISLEEVGTAMPAIRPLTRGISRVKNAEAKVQLHGTAEKLDVEAVALKVPGIVTLDAKGAVEKLTDPKKLSGDITMTGRLTGGEYLHRVMRLDSTLRVPNVNLRCRADYRNSRLAAHLRALVDTSRVVLDGNWAVERERYRGSLSLTGFDVRSFMPRGTIGIVDGDISVDGRGYNPYKMQTVCSAVINEANYDGVTYRDLLLDASLDKGDYQVDFSSLNEFADVTLNLKGRMTPDRYMARIVGNVNNIDLNRMNLSADRLGGGMNVHAFVDADLKRDYYAGLVRLSELRLQMAESTFSTDSLNVGFRADSASTNLRLRNNDLLLSFHSPLAMFPMLDTLARTGAALDTMLLAQRLKVDELQRTLPDFTFEMKSGKRNILYTYLSNMGVTYDAMHAEMENSDRLRINSDMRGLLAGGLALDTLMLDSYTEADSLHYAVNVRNSKQNNVLFKRVDAGGYVTDNKLSLALKQVDKTGTTGFDFGTLLSVADSVVTLSLFPQKPVIAFRNWEINDGNYLSLDLRNRSLLADMKIKSGDHNYLNIYTAETNAEYHGLNVDLAGIELGEWLTFSPFAPPVEGTLASEFKLFYYDKYVWGDGNVGISNLRYGKRRVGDIGLITRVAYLGQDNRLMAKAAMNVDGREVVNVTGYRNDSLDESTYDLKLDIKRFPFASVNAFLPDVVGNMAGYLNGSMAVKGTLNAPEIDGYVQFDSARVNMPVFGSSLAFDTVRIPVEQGTVKFNRFGIFGQNKNAINFDGEVRLQPFDRMYADLKINGRNVQIVQGNKTSKSELYGKGFIDVMASVRGYMDELDMSASLSVLSGTDLTYVMQSDAVAVAESTTDDMVTFVALNDTVKKQPVDTLAARPFAMRINAVLAIQPNALFTVNLSPDGKNKVQINGDGTLNYSQTYQGDMNMTGRYVINGGFTRYTPPMLSEKLFKFVEGSSVTWNGDLLNPLLNIKAIQTIKANVTSENQDSRIVPFEVSLNVGNTLEQLDLSFDLSTDGDVSIANELSSMTKEQRSSQAMNLLLYNTYTGSSTSKASANLSGNVVNSFLESSLNKWAADNISGVDLSFGINQYDKTVDGATSTTTNYSYQVSKTVFDDRFKIVVGGSYSTDASAEDNLSQNLINDISFEYKLNKTGTAYVKLFHHTEYESILEGEITETGAGLVWKRKISSWRDMFRIFRLLRRTKKVPAPTPAPVPEQPADSATITNPIIETKE